ncbi:MAG: hypothetical protein V2B15_13870 [Bacteroidota bacterium]
MKIVSYILVLGMVFLGLNRFTEGIPSILQEEQQCQMDCCCSHDGDCGDCGDSGNDEASCTNDQHCPPGCDCSCNFHHNVVAIEYFFQPDFELIPQAADFGTFFNSYQFEFFYPHFQPPRFS